MGLSAPHDPYGSPGRSPGRTTRPDDISGFHTRRTDDVRDATVEDMRRTASLVEEQMGALKAIIDRATAAGSATDLALKARQSLEAEWWDAKESAEDTKLISYQKADAYIKRACTRMSGQRKWIASSNKNAGKTLDESLEELRLASLVLQQKHEEEAHASETLAKTSVELTGSVRAEHHAMSRLRSDLEPAVVAIVASMEELRSNLTRAAAAQARRAAEMPPTPAPPPRFPPATDVPVIPQIVHTFVEKPGLAAPDPELLDELRRQRERADDAALSLQRSQNAAQQDQANLLEEMSKLREKLGREAAAAAVLKAEAEKWRAMYDAASGAGRRGATPSPDFASFFVAFRSRARSAGRMRAALIVSSTRFRPRSPESWTPNVTCTEPFEPATALWGTPDWMKSTSPGKVSTSSHLSPATSSSANVILPELFSMKRPTASIGETPGTWYGAHRLQTFEPCSWTMMVMYGST